MTPPKTVTPAMVERLSSLSPAHRLTVAEFLKTGRWILTDGMEAETEAINRFDRDDL
jgi:hypothetical protein